MDVHDYSRRRFLALAALATSAVALAACGGTGQSAGPTPAPTQPPAPPTAAPKATAAPAATTAAVAPAAPTTAPAPNTTPAPKAAGSGQLTWDTFRGIGTPWPDDRIKAFQEVNTGWTVQLRPITIGQSQQDAYPKMYAMFASGTLGDVFAFDPSHWEFYRAVPNGLIRAIDDYVSQDHFDLTQFFPPFIEMQKWQGKQWGLPSWGWSGQDGFIYNQVIFKDMGIPEPDYNSPEWTMDNIREIAKKLTKMGSGGAYDRFGMNLALGAAGATVYSRAYNNPDFYEPKKSNILDPNVTKGFKWVQDMAQTDKSIALPGGFQGDTTDLFASGKLAILQSGSLVVFNAQKAIKDDKLAVVRAALFPKRQDGKRPSQMRGGTWNVGAKSKNPEAAWKFVQTLCNHDGTLKFNTIGGNGALVRPDIMDDPYFKHPGFQPFRENLLTAMPAVVPGNGRGTEFEQTIVQSWGELYLGKIDFDSGIKKLNDAVQRVLDKPEA